MLTHLEFFEPLVETAFAKTALILL